MVEWRIKNFTGDAACQFTAPHSPFAFLRRFRRELLALLDRLFDGADHVEGLLGQMIVFAFAQTAETLDGVGEIDELAGRAGEDFGNEERLRQEALDLARARDRDLVLFATIRPCREWR